MIKYIKWRKPRGGVKHEAGPDAGKQRNCMHCGKSAVHAAVLVTDNHRMDVWCCGDHESVMREVNNGQ
jgi:hypothetical protein